MSGACLTRRLVRYNREQARHPTTASKSTRHDHPPPLAYWVDDLSPFVIRFWGQCRHPLVRTGLRARFPGGRLADDPLPPRRALRAAGRPRWRISSSPWSPACSSADGSATSSSTTSTCSLHDPLVLFRVWEGGMASHGGFVGVFLARRGGSPGANGLPFLHLADVLASTVPVGLLLGRIANFINGELWGKITDVPWAVIFPKSASAACPSALIPPRHPSQLYEAGLEGALLLAFMQWRFWKSDVVRTQPGRLSGEFMVGLRRGADRGRDLPRTRRGRLAHPRPQPRHVLFDLPPAGRSRVDHPRPARPDFGRSRDPAFKVGRVFRNAPLFRIQLVGGLGITRPTFVPGAGTCPQVGRVFRNAPLFSSSWSAG